MKKYKIAIAAAGTAGHINPGIAIANKILEERDDVEIYFIGTERGLEVDLIPKAGFRLRTIEAYGFGFSLSLENFRRQYVNFFVSKKMAKKVLEEENTDLVIGTGGYITFSVGGAASKLNIPILLHESNAYPGLAIRTLNKKATKILTGFEKTKEYLKRKDNVVFVGNPINLKKKDVNREEVLDELALLNNKITILVFGGSQGAQRINNAVVPLIKEEYFKEKDVQLILATGKKNFEDIKEDLKEAGKHIEKIENVKILPYIYNMEGIMNSSDLGITRAGAMTVSELIEVELPTIFIPLPSQKANRQIDNARILESAGSAKIIKNEELDKESLKKVLDEILSDENNIKNMKDNLTKIKTENLATDKIYDIVKEYLK